MEQIPAELLAGLVTGLGGQMSKAMWDKLVSLIHRPHQPDPQAAPSGKAELTALEQAPADLTLAQKLSAALMARSSWDADFRADLEKWHRSAIAVTSDRGQVNNSIGGNSPHSTMIQARDVHGPLSVGSPPPPPEDELHPRATPTTARRPGRRRAGRGREGDL